MSGRLLVVSTPIGNLGDITPRVKDALATSAFVLAEDTRVSQKLLFHLGLRTQLISCHEFNETKRVQLLEEAVAQNQTIALVSDAGTPLVSDPGYQIVQRAIKLGMQVVPIPGPSAVIAALVGSGLPSDRFAFEGFLPDKAGDRRARLERTRADDRTLIYFAAPSNLEAVLGDMQQIFGDRPACLARELTKLHEEFIRGTLSQLIGHLQDKGTRGEYVLVVGGASGEETRVEKAVVERRLHDLLADGGRLKDVSAVLARETGWSSSEIYKLGLAIKEGRDQQS